MVSGIRPVNAGLVAFTLAAGLALGGLAGGCGGSGAGPGGTGGAAGNGAAGTSAMGGAGGKAAPDAATTDAAAPFVSVFDFAVIAQAAVATVANGGDTNPGDLGVHASGADGGGLATIGWDGQAGSPEPGSLQIHLPCNAYGQFVDYQFVLPIITDMGGKTLSLMLRLDGGFSPEVAAEGYVLLYAKSGDNWDWGQTAAVPIAPTSAGQWIQYTFPMAAPSRASSSNFDPGYVKSVGLQINTGSANGVTSLPTPATFHLDSIGYQ
jgi:hypothetical protein